jgi:glycine betaine/proline transport system substrate-binding protein
MAGVNQTVMLALSMVVTASMIGAPGLGRQVLTALQRASVGSGFVSGLGIVILAILIDRLTNRFTSDD